MLANTNLYREINQQPAALSELLAAEKKNFVNLAQAIRQRDLSHVIIAARGTSDNAARYAQYVLGAINFPWRRQAFSLSIARFQSLAMRS
jgi:glucosamine--fructose-6-phosphate aminotransferase (isomerizing)